MPVSVCARALCLFFFECAHILGRREALRTKKKKKNEKKTKILNKAVYVSYFLSNALFLVGFLRWDDVPSVCLFFYFFQCAKKNQRNGKNTRGFAHFDEDIPCLFFSSFLSFQ